MLPTYNLLFDKKTSLFYISTQEDGYDFTFTATEVSQPVQDSIQLVKDGFTISSLAANVSMVHTQLEELNGVIATYIASAMSDLFTFKLFDTECKVRVEANDGYEFKFYLETPDASPKDYLLSTEMLSARMGRLIRRWEGDTTLQQLCTVGTAAGLQAIFHRFRYHNAVTTHKGLHQQWAMEATQLQTCWTYLLTQDQFMEGLYYHVMRYRFVERNLDQVKEHYNTFAKDILKELQVVNSKEYSPYYKVKTLITPDLRSYVESLGLTYTNKGTALSFLKQVATRFDFLCELHTAGIEATRDSLEVIVSQTPTSTSTAHAIPN